MKIAATLSPDVKTRLRRYIALGERAPFPSERTKLTFDGDYGEELLATCLALYPDRIPNDAINLALADGVVTELEMTVMHRLLHPPFEED